MTTPLPVAVIGAGHMGRHHVRKYAEMEETRLVAVIDKDLERARALAEPLGVQAADHYEPTLGDIAAATIAVPTIHHLEVARPLIEAGIAVLIEKPLAPNVADAEEIAALAQKHGAVVGVGHTERFNPAVQAVARLGLRPKFIETHRISPFTFRSADVSVVFDMMIHDIDIVLHLVRGEQVKHVDAYGVNVLAPSEDITNARVVFDRGAVANLTASRLALKTERKLRVFCRNAYISLDYQKKNGIAITLDKNLDILKLARERNIDDLSQLAGVDFGKMVTVEPLAIDDQDALNAELKAFITAVRERSTPPVSVEDGVAAVRLATQIIESARSHKWSDEPGDVIG
ncbi:MAG: Gfo/Idh/MocA family oxidoreductase [Phycisphaerae bacterium]|nr:Gfo/Idh/MocA family oxidoreductase [Phycisphaerae bacterium]